MALNAYIPADDVARAVTTALEELLGHDVVLSPSDARAGRPEATDLPWGPTRSVALPFATGVVGEVTLVVTEQFATTIEAATDDASLVTGTAPVLFAAASVISGVLDVPVRMEDVAEISTETLLAIPVGEFVAIPVLESDEPVATIVVRVVTESATAHVVDDAGDDFTTATTAVPVPAPAIALHEFQPIGTDSAGLGAPRPLPLLNDVEIEVVAELGHRRISVRELVALVPGSVVELDRAAGSPVDVIVNGAVIAHGEVVVIDEEFGIRVSEIVVGDM